MSEVFSQIIGPLNSSGVQFRTFEHPPVRTSEEAAAARGMPLERGAKALVLECGEDLIMVVISAAAKVSFRSLKQALNSRRMQMASPQRVLAATGCEPGGVPPFGHLFGLPVYVDPSLLEQECIDFNAGDRSRSVEMRSADWLRLSGARVLAFADRSGSTAQASQKRRS